MEQLGSSDHARILYRDWLEALRKLREAQNLYMDRVSHYERERKTVLGLGPGDKLPAAEQRMASMRAESDDQLKVAKGRVTFYMELVRTMAMSYLVEVDYGWRFNAELPN